MDEGGIVRPRCPCVGDENHLAKGWTQATRLSESNYLLILTISYQHLRETAVLARFILRASSSTNFKKPIAWGLCDFAEEPAEENRPAQSEPSPSLVQP